MDDVEQTMTIDQLPCADFPEKRIEVVDGVVHRMTPASARHGLIGANVLALLLQHARGNRLGEVFLSETGFVLRRAPDTLRCPDVAFVSAERLCAHGIPRGMMTVAPDLAVEILSPSDGVAYVERKVRDYFAADVRMAWLIDDRARTVAIRVPGAAGRIAGETDMVDGGDVVPGFKCPVASFFESVPRDAPNEFETRYADLRHWPFRSRVLMPLCDFGLLEERRLPAEKPWMAPVEYRKSPLYDRFLRFDFPGSAGRRSR